MNITIHKRCHINVHPIYSLTSYLFGRRSYETDNDSGSSNADCSLPWSKKECNLRKQIFVT